MVEQDFLDAILSEPADRAIRLVYADWLDELGDPRGELIRIQEELRRIDVPGRRKTEARLWELLREGVEPLQFGKTNSIGMKFVLIFPGEFLMGSPAEEPGRHPKEDLHPVRISEPFYLSIHQFTERDYFWMYDEPSDDQENRGRLSRERIPRTLSWFDAAELCNRLSLIEHLPDNYQFTRIKRNSEGRLKNAAVDLLHTAGYRLPSEAEWEYACRAGTTTPAPFGKKITKKLANFGKTATGGLQRPGIEAVGKYPSNASGLFDMIGNIWEWCWDWLDDDYYSRSPQIDPWGPAEGEYAVSRGSGHLSNAPSCRSAFRNRLAPANDTTAGFRMVLPFQSANEIERRRNGQ